MSYDLCVDDLLEFFIENIINYLLNHLKKKYFFLKVYIYNKRKNCFIFIFRPKSESINSDK